MYYVVNNETKEHEVGKGFTPWGWHAVEADDQGWIKWGGGECPLPRGESCEARFTDGEESDIPRAGDHPAAWRGRLTFCSFVAYRPACYHGHKEGDAEWDGEGLPPVGSRVEFDWAGCRQEGDVISHHDGDAVVAFQPVGFNHWQYSRASEINARPSPCPEQRAVEAVAQAIRDEICVQTVAEASARSVVDAIRAGRIPGVKLDQ